MVLKEATLIISDKRFMGTFRENQFIIPEWKSWISCEISPNNVCLRRHFAQTSAKLQRSSSHPLSIPTKFTNPSFKALKGHNFLIILFNWNLTRSFIPLQTSIYIYHITCEIKNFEKSRISITFSRFSSLYNLENVFSSDSIFCNLSFLFYFGTEDEAFCNRFLALSELRF